MGCIYIIKNKINNKVYIGQTMQSVEERYKQHLKSCRCKQHYKIYRAMNKYGVDNFYYEILERDVKEEDIDEREIYWIEYYDSFKNGYNSTTGGDGRTIYKELDIDYIVQSLKDGKQMKELAEEFNVNVCTIRRTLDRNNISSKDIQNKKISQGKPQIKIDRNMVKDLHNKGLTVNEIAKEMNCNVKTIRRIKHELNLEFERPRYDYSNIKEEDILSDRNNGMKVDDILKKYNISYGYYYKLIKNQTQIIETQTTIL